MKNKKCVVDIIVDMQNDFIDGSLGTKEAKEIVPKVVETIKEAANTEHAFFATMDTHKKDYAQSREGKALPVEHCIENSAGWEMNKDVEAAILNSDKYILLKKGTFGSSILPSVIQSYVDPDEIEKFRIYGLCTDICVISNAMILRAFFPEKEIEILSDCCAGVTPESHETALNAMKACQMKIL